MNQWFNPYLIFLTIACSRAEKRTADPIRRMTALQWGPLKPESNQISKPCLVSAPPSLPDHNLLTESCSLIPALSYKGGRWSLTHKIGPGSLIGLPLLLTNKSSLQSTVHSMFIHLWRNWMYYKSKELVHIELAPCRGKGNCLKKHTYYVRN